MPIPPNFPTSPHAILEPSGRWVPSRANPDTEKLPPLVQDLRERVKVFRESDYEGAAETSRSLLKWWFQEEHWLATNGDASREFQYYFAQREALETIVYLYDVKKVKDKLGLIEFDSSDSVSKGMFDENWLRLVIKMATGSGKTKVLSLALAWCYFHKRYEPDSKLARNFLIIAPNIIVLDRLRKDIDGLRIFHSDPILPENGYAGCNWRDDFQLTVHVQDEVRANRNVGNIFLTNIHRVYSGDEIPPSPDDVDATDYFLGKRPTGATTDSKVDLGMIVRDINELVVFNDEAHHIHSPNMAWFKSIEDIHNRLKQKGGELALQVDTTATPKHNNGAIFVQTVADYPLVEAIAQNVVKHPVIPDLDSRRKLAEKSSSKFSERYGDYLNLGVVEWRKACAENAKADKKAILFVMTDDTKNCDEVAKYLETTFPDLQDAVLVIHTKQNGDISEAATGKKKEELDALRKDANEIDSMESRYKAIVSVLVLKEGWDVRNVTTIVGLRAYSAKSNILPEQTLGRGLRRMFPEQDAEEKLSVIGTDAFMEFVESIEREGVTLERESMGGEDDDDDKKSRWIEVDTDNPAKDIADLDIRMPVLAPRHYREYELLDSLDSKMFSHRKIMYREFDQQEARKISFKYIAKDGTSHETVLDESGIADYRSVVGFFSQMIMKDMRLTGVYDIVYEKIKIFIRDDLFDRVVDLDDRNTLRNLFDERVTKTVAETMKKAINEITLRDKGETDITEYISVAEMRPFRAKPQNHIVSHKSAVNEIIGDYSFELKFANFLEQCDDIVSYVKNYYAIGFRLDYVNSVGDLTNYFPDFLIKKSPSEVYIVETKGQEGVNLAAQMKRLRQWCADANSAQTEAKYDFVYVPQRDFERYRPRSFAALISNFREYKTEEDCNASVAVR